MRVFVDVWLNALNGLVRGGVGINCFALKFVGFDLMS